MTNLVSTMHLWIFIQTYLKLSSYIVHCRLLILTIIPCPVFYSIRVWINCYASWSFNRYPFGNALKFTKEGTISISVEINDHGQAVVSVKDTGQGIDPNI